MNAIAPYAKAIVGALLAGLGSVWTALDDGALSSREWVAVAIAALGVLAGVYAVPNAPAKIPTVRPVPPPR